MASDFSVELPLHQPARAGEKALVARAAAGDHQAYAALIRPHERIAYRVAAAIKELFDVADGALLWEDAGVAFLLQGAGTKDEAARLAADVTP